MQKWNIFRLLVILMVSIPNKGSTQALHLVKQTSFPLYSSASSLQFYNKRLYVFGDDAPFMLVLNKHHQVKDSIRLFKDNVRRMDKNTKADLEASFLLQKEKETFVFAVASFSEKPRNKVLRLSLTNGQKGLETFSMALVTGQNQALNIEGATVVGDNIILSNRANRTQKNNQLLVLKMDTEKGFATAITHTIIVQLPPSKEVIGISGLDYIKDKDLLLLTASTELTNNALEDGEIGTSYFGYITNFSKKLQQKTITIDTFLDLTPVLQQKGAQKIESVTVEKVKRKSATLHLAADNDDGSSHLFKIRFKLPAVR